MSKQLLHGLYLETKQTKLESLLSFNKTYLISNEFKKDIKQTAEDWT